MHSDEMRRYTSIPLQRNSDMTYPFVEHFVVPSVNVCVVCAMMDMSCIDEHCPQPPQCAISFPPSRAADAVGNVKNGVSLSSGEAFLAHTR
mmetsp:Transcript_16138/g.33127  ORF Transcript_16138/g.33127 Transcript_16138/m.33127 type:complete len:91 (+) Transcript_16138:561-833(+)